jgi:S-adenosylmethionine:tRNA ribosyltransferase-isomerase
MIAVQEYLTGQPSVPTRQIKDRFRELGEEHRPLDFELPRTLEAGRPPEARGLVRDEVRLMVSYRRENVFCHSQFHCLAEFLAAGDLLVINTSGTLPAALAVIGDGNGPLELHLSTRLPDGCWTVELRQMAGAQNQPFLAARPGERLRLPGGASATLLRPYREWAEGVRLWVARLAIPDPFESYINRFGVPIRYQYVAEPWPLDYYQTIYATEVGSAEMPSAGRAFTERVMKRLAARRVQIAPLILHTGVASLEDHEPPYEEYYRVPEPTARMVNDALAAGRRVIAVGTTVVRALETVTDAVGNVHAGEGWTGLVITPQHGLRAVNGLLTGFHEPKASHLLMLETLAGRSHLSLAYQQAVEQGYLWHEFGDLHLILP